MRRFKDPMVFLKLEVSAVLAASPINRCLAVNEMSDLNECISESASSRSSNRNLLLLLYWKARDERGSAVGDLVGLESGG